MNTTISAKAYKGMGMEGFTARWYASLTHKSLDEFKALARRVSSQIPAGATSGHISFIFGQTSSALGQSSFAFGHIASHAGRRGVSADGIFSFHHSFEPVMVTISVWVR